MAIPTKPRLCGKSDRKSGYGKLRGRPEKREEIRAVTIAEKRAASL